MAGCGVLDQVLQRLRDRRGRVQAQEIQHRLGVLAGVERAPDRGDREAVNRGGALAFRVGHGEEFLGQVRREITGRHRSQVGLEQDMVQGGRQVFAQDAHRLVGLFGGDGCADLAERARADEAEQFGLGQDPADQRAEAPCHPGLGPVGAFQHGRGVQDRGLPVGGRGLLGQFGQDFQDPFPDHRGVRALGFGRERVDGAAGRAAVQGRDRGMAVDGLTHKGRRALAGEPGIDQPEPLLLARKRQPLRLRRLDPGGTVHVQADEAGQGAQLGQHPGVVHLDPQPVGQALELPDAHAAAAQGDERLFTDAVKQFTHEPQGLGDRAQGGVAAERCRGGAQPRHRGSQCDLLDDKAAAQRDPDAVRKLHVGRVQRHQEPAGQEPVHRPDVGGLVQHGGAPLCLGNGAHGPVPEACEQRRSAFRGGGQDLPQGLRSGRPVLQRQCGLHRGGRGGDGRAAAVQFPDELDHALRESRLEPDQFGVAAAEPGRVDPDDVLEAADGQVVALFRCRGRRCAGRRFRPVDEGQFLERMQHLFDGSQGRAVDQLLQHRSGGAVPGVRVRAQVQGFEDLHLRAVQPLQGALHADAAAGAGSEGGEVRHARGDQVRPRGEKGPQRVIAACLQFLAQRADKRHQCKATSRPALGCVAGLRHRRSQAGS